MPLAAAIFSNFAQLINKGESGVRAVAEDHRVLAAEALEDGSEDPFGLSRPFSAYRGFDLKQVANMFPKHLQISVFFSLHGEQLRQIPMFADVEDSFLQELALELGTHVLLQDDFAFGRTTSATKCSSSNSARSRSATRTCL